MNPFNVVRELVRLIEKESYSESEIVAEETETASRILNVLMNGVIPNVSQVETLDCGEENQSEAAENETSDCQNPDFFVTIRSVMQKMKDVQTIKLLMNRNFCRDYII
jgi:hypothetical protein